MWGLYNLSDISTVYYLSSGQTYIIGRKESDIIITKDPSISRRHAKINIKVDDSVVFSDLKSKFGSKVNNVTVTTDVEVHDNDILLIGQGPTKLRLCKRQLTFCCSNMPVSAKKEVKALAEQLGGCVQSNWSSSCTHLVMTSITVTVKVVNALSTCSPIVTLQWLVDCVKHFKGKIPLPSFKNYQPPIVDKNLNADKDSIDLSPSIARQQLFENKLIYFLDKNQLSSLAYCILSAEGKYELMEIGLSPSIYCADNCLVIDPGNKKNAYREAVDKELEKRGLRFIKEAEIGHAFVHQSTDRFCNPKSILVNPVPTHVPTGSLSQQSCSNLTQSTFYNTQQPNTQQTDSTILAPNTQLSQMGVVRKGGLNQSSVGVTKVNESVIKEEPCDESSINVNAMETTVNEIVPNVKSEPNTTLQNKHPPTTKPQASDRPACSGSLQSNASILAMDSAPQSGSLSSSVRENIISSAFKSRKRNRNIEGRPIDSDSKRLKPEPHSDTDIIDLTSVDVTDIEQNQITSRSPSPPLPQATPIQPSFNDNGFMSARKRTPVKSQTGSNNKRMRISLEQSQINTQIDTENPLPCSSPPRNGDITEVPASSKIVHETIDGFISARRRPAIVNRREHEVKVTEDSEDYSSYPLPVIENTALVIKKKTVSTSTDESTSGNIVNYKRFKKVPNPGSISSNFNRLIGGSDLFEFVVTTATVQES